MRPTQTRDGSSFLICTKPQVCDATCGILFVCLVSLVTSVFVVTKSRSKGHTFERQRSKGRRDELGMALHSLPGEQRPVHQHGSWLLSLTTQQLITPPTQKSPLEKCPMCVAIVVMSEDRCTNYIIEKIGSSKTLQWDATHSWTPVATCSRGNHHDDNFAGQQVFIPRTPLIPSTNEIPFQFKRIQLPIRLCFSVMINKAQGQSPEVARLKLDNDVFCHGQLYVG